MSIIWKMACSLLPGENIMCYCFFRRDTMATPHGVTQHWCLLPGLIITGSGSLLTVLLSEEWQCYCWTWLIMCFRVQPGLSFGSRLQLEMFIYLILFILWVDFDTCNSSVPHYLLALTTLFKRAVQDPSQESLSCFTDCLLQFLWFLCFFLFFWCGPPFN